MKNPSSFTKTCNPKFSNHSVSKCTLKREALCGTEAEWYIWLCTTGGGRVIPVGVYNIWWIVLHYLIIKPVHMSAPSQGETVTGVRSCRQSSVWEEGINVTVLNSTESHWVWIEEEDVEESCNNKRSESRGRKSYDSNWDCLSSAGFGKTPFSGYCKGLWCIYVPLFHSYSRNISVESLLMTGPWSYFGNVQSKRLDYIDSVKTRFNLVFKCGGILTGFPSGEALWVLKVVFTLFHV